MCLARLMIKPSYNRPPICLFATRLSICPHLYGPHLYDEPTTILAIELVNPIALAGGHLKEPAYDQNRFLRLAPQ